jgi:hypothetical protein
MEERCKNCWWWSSFTEIRERDEWCEMDHPAIEQAPETWGGCKAVSANGTTQGTWVAGHPAPLAYARDFEEYAAQLITSPDFGCVQFKPRDEQPRLATP